MAMDEKAVVRALIDQIRKEIDALDEDIIDLVRARTDKAVQVARLKRSNNIPLVNGSREMDVFSRYASALGRFGRTMATALLLRARQTESDFGKDDKDSDPKNLG